MLVYSAERQELVGLNGSGRSPRTASIEALREKGYTLPEMPLYGIGPVNVPGVVDGWSMALERYGKFDLATALAPAIAYAQYGFPVTDKLARAIEKFRQGPGYNPEWAKIYLKDTKPDGSGGRAPKPGEVLSNPALAQTYRTLAKSGRNAFYSETGSIARAIANYSSYLGGFLALDDLKTHKGEWVQPLSTLYHGYRIYELPPNTQGIAALLMYRLMEGFDLKDHSIDAPENIHLAVEAKKRAFLVRDQYLTDPAFMTVDPLRLLQPEFVDSLRHQIDRATPPELPDQLGGDTVYLCAVDNRGNAVSLIQSIYHSFGSGVVVPETGLLLHNRGCYFSLDPRHVNRLEGGKRTLHTLIPAMAFDERESNTGLSLERGPALVFGTMGGDAQAQVHWQFINGWLDHNLNVQEAIERPRWRSGRINEEDDLNTVHLEGRFPPETAARLRQLGHSVQITDDWNESMGHCQAIALHRTSSQPGSPVVMEGGADPRGDGAAVGW
jgi:gamma-glutamyltranspeptidase/glutathione hydrolase